MDRLALLNTCSFLLTVLLTTYVGASPVSNRNASEKCNWEDLDWCAKKAILIGDVDAFVPLTKDDLKISCTTDKAYISCIRKNMNSCLREQPLARQVTSLIVGNLEDMARRRCFDEDYQKRYLEASSCLYNSKAEMDACMISYVKISHRITKADPDYRIPLLCCGTHELTKCSKSAVRKICNEKDIPYMEEFIEDYRGDALSLLCDDPETEAKKCEKIELPSLAENETLPQSVVPSGVKIISSFS